MMHHPNMHHQAMSGHPPQHLGGHQGMPGHHQLPPHQMHRENRVAMGPSQGGGMGGPGAHGQMGGMGGLGLPHHGPGPRPPHPVRPMHHPPAQHHSVPPGMKPMRRSYGMGGGYPAGGPGVVYTPPMQPPAQPLTHHVTHHGVTPTTASAPVAGSPAAGSEAGEGGEARGPAEAARPAPAPALANSKEKTPMCLVNELARYNKIKHQYRLTSETGPAHKKVFTVTLRLGDTEEYTAEGSSIKRAQHAAAGTALAQTQFPAPPPRAQPAHAPAGAHHRHAGTVMPTVELNALAMKLCQPAVYTSVPPLAAPPRFPRARPPAPYRLPGPFAPYTNRLLAPGLTYRVRVCVGGRVWMGEGPTPQAARHDAAARALQDLRPPPDAAAPAPAPPDGEAKLAEGAGAGAGAEAAAELGSELKSPVSLVHELALKRNLSVVFTVKSERGPPHMRVFITACTVGDMETEGEGNGKKVSKRRAAEKMLDEMRRRWPPALLRPRPPPQLKRKQQPTKKKPRNLIKDSGEPAAEGGGDAADNPISRLAMARHAARARSPQYRVLEERGAARKREFVVQCDAPPHRATGLGPNKKTAKRRAAYNVLIAMDLIPGVADGEGSLPSNGDPASPTTSDAGKLSGSDSKQKESEGAGAGGAGGEARQPVPGVLMMDYHQRGAPAQSNGVGEGAGPSSPGSKDQLMYLSQLLGFTVQFSDFPKRNHGEYLSLVSLSTEPPVMCHGGGASTAQSHEQCARAALRALTLMGLDAPGTPTLPGGSPGAAPLSNGLAE